MATEMTYDEIMTLIAAHDHRMFATRFEVAEVLMLHCACGVVLDQDDLDAPLRTFVQTEHDALVQLLADLHPGFLGFHVRAETEAPAEDAAPVEMIEAVLDQYSDRTLRYEQSVWNSLNLQDALTQALQSPAIPAGGREFLTTLRASIHAFLKRLDPRFMTVMGVDDSSTP